MLTPENAVEFDCPSCGLSTVAEAAFNGSLVTIVCPACGMSVEGALCSGAEVETMLGSVPSRWQVN